jgi:hypothetical protein
MLHEIQRLVYDRVRYGPIFEMPGRAGWAPRVEEPALLPIDRCPWSAPLEEVRLKQNLVKRPTPPSSTSAVAAPEPAPQIRLLIAPRWDERAGRWGRRSQAKGGSGYPPSRQARDARYLRPSTPGLSQRPKDAAPLAQSIHLSRKT